MNQPNATNSTELTLKQKILTTTALVALMAIAAAISLTYFTNSSLRLDEAQSLWQTSHSTRGLLKVLAEDVHVPLYHLILRYLQSPFGSSLGVARLFSLGCFITTIPMVYLLGKRGFNHRTGLIAAVLVSISPFMVWYGSEARMYAMLALVTVINQYFFIGIAQNRSRQWWAYALSAVIGIYTHYFFAFVLLTQGMFYLLKRKDFPEGSFIRFSATAVFVAASFAPWLVYVRSLGLANSTQPRLGAPSTIDVFNTFAQFLFGFQVDSVNTIIVSLWPLMVLLVLLAVQNRKSLPLAGKYFTLATFLPIVGAFGLSLVIKPLYLSRYLIVALPSMAFLVVWLLSTYPRRIAWSVGSLLFAAIIFSSRLQITSAATPVKENYRQASEYLEQNSSARDVIIISAPFTIYPIEYYYGGQASLTTLPIWNRYQDEPLPQFKEDELAAQADKLLGNHQQAWVLLSYDQGYRETIRAYFENKYQRVGRRKFSPDLELYVYQLRYDSPVVLEQPPPPPLP